MRSILACVLVLSAASSARAQAIPSELPDRLSIELERPDAPGRFLHLDLERSATGAALVGCETARARVGCRATRRIAIDAGQLAHLRRVWRTLASGVRCRARRPSGHWLPTQLTFGSTTLEGLVYEHGERGLGGHCFPIERIGGWFLDRWRAGP